MGHEDIVWEEDLTIRVLCWSWGILSLSDRSRLLNSVGVSEADATRDVAPVIAGARSRDAFRRSLSVEVD